MDEEEEHERKLIRIQRRKLRKQTGESGEGDESGGEDDEEFEESMSIYEEEEDADELLHPTMSFEEDIDDLQSYRNHHHNNHVENLPDEHNNFLNESTADFNKEIR